MGDATDDLAERLSRLLDGAGITDLARLSGGASRETWSFSADGRALVLQRQQAGAIDRPGVGPVVEAELFRAAGEAGVPVPPVVDASTDVEAVGAPYLLMQSVQGETIARRILRDDAFSEARLRLAGQCGQALAALHSVPLGAFPTLEERDPIAQQQEVLDLLGEAHPALELGLRWLDQHRPPPTPGGASIVHGDFRLGNLIVGPEGLRAVIDWELAHRGDPMEDLGWLCVRAWRFGSSKPVAGVGEYAQLFDAYESAGGGEVHPEAVKWWELFGTVRWGVICVMQAAGHLTGVVRSHELAAIGRRVCQTEHDVLRMLASTEGATAPRGAAAATWNGAPHDRPTAPELVEAVREWLEDDVADQTEGRLRFHVRVAANMLAMVERELSLGPGQQAEHVRRLAAIGVADDAELVAGIRAGRFDGEGWDEVTASVAETVRDKLAVADPNYPEQS